MQKLSWLTVNEDTDTEGFYKQGPDAYEAERRALEALGAPQTEAIQFESILPEDRDSAMATALVPHVFAEWAKQHQETGEPTTEDENGDSNLVWYGEE